MFKNLDEEQVNAIILDMFRIDVAKDTAIIKQGDTGDYFYIVESGSFDVFVRYCEIHRIDHLYLVNKVLLQLMFMTQKALGNALES